MSKERVIQEIKDFFKKNEINYFYSKEDNSFRIDYVTDDFPMKHRITVFEGVQVINLFSYFPFSFPEDLRIKGAMALNMLNSSLFTGAFVYDFADGSFFYRQSIPFTDEPLNDYFLHFLIDHANQIIDKVNDKLFLISKDKLSLDDFLNNMFKVDEE